MYLNQDLKPSEAYPPTQIEAVMPTMSLQGLFEEFLTSTNNKRFLCTKALEAHSRGKIGYVEMPRFDTSLEQALQCRERFGPLPTYSIENRDAVLVDLLDALDRFSKKDIDSIIILQHGNPDNHIEGFNNTWLFYRLYYAAIKIKERNYKRTSNTFSRIEEEATRFTRQFNSPQLLKGYTRNGWLSLDNEELTLMVLNALYEGRKCPFSEAQATSPRFSPTTTYHIQRWNDIVRTKEQEKGIAKAISMRSLNDSEYLYNGTLPYIIPGDDRFMVASPVGDLYPSFLKIWNSCTHRKNQDPFKAYSRYYALVIAEHDESDLIPQLQREGLF